MSHKKNKTVVKFAHGTTIIIHVSTNTLSQKEPHFIATEITNLSTNSKGTESLHSHSFCYNLSTS